MGYTADTALADVINVARFHGTASQSTLGFSLPASNAIDGSLSSISHTDTDDLTPSWRVDLDADFAIENINVFNRESCCQERFYNLTVEVLDASDTPVFTSPLFNPWDGVTPADPVDLLPFPNDPIQINLTGMPGGGVTGRAVRVSKGAVAGSEWLSLAEVEVFAEGELPPLPPELDPNVNVALSKPTSGDVAFGFPTSNGNDGDVATFTHADNANAPPDNPFWMVDLEAEFDLRRIEIVDRADCCDPNRLEGSILTVLDATMAPIFESIPIAGLTTPSSGELITFDIGGAGFSGAAHIRVDGFNQYFQFAELRAFVVPEPSSILLMAAGLGAFSGARRLGRRYRSWV
jgi:hypothetical protein